MRNPGYEDDRTFAFLDIYPTQPGHTLVVPKVEVRQLWDLDNDYLTRLKRVDVLRRMITVTTATELWAPFALRVRCGPLELRAITDDDIPPLVDLALSGIHDPAVMPFAHPWTDTPKGDLARSTAAYYWSARAWFSPAKWTLDLAVRVDGELVGVQGIATQDYLVLRSAETGSWLGRQYQGRGIGTAMRQVVCAFMFDHLDAAEMTSGAFTDNPASLTVSRKVGYVDNGTFRQQRRPGELAAMRKLVLRPSDLVRPEHALEVNGIAPLRAAIGLDDCG